MWTDCAGRGLPIAGDGRPNGLLAILQNHRWCEIFGQRGRGVRREELLGRRGVHVLIVVGNGCRTRCSARCRFETFGWRRFRSQLFDAFGEILERWYRRFEVRFVNASIEVRRGNLRANREPATPDGRFACEQVQTATAQTEVLDDMVQLQGFVRVAPFGFFADDQIDVDIRMNEIGVHRTADSTSNAHEAMLL